MSGVHSRGLKFGPIAEANHAAESTLGCDPVIIIIIILIFVIIIILILVVIFVIIIMMSIFVRTTVGAMELMELESVTCSSRTLITGLPSACS